MKKLTKRMARTKSWQKKKLIKKKRKKLWRKKTNKKNKANWMISNSAKVDRRTKQHTQFGVSASNGSRDMALTKSWWKKKEKILK